MNMTPKRSKKTIEPLENLSNNIKSVDNNKSKPIPGLKYKSSNKNEKSTQSLSPIKYNSFAKSPTDSDIYNPFLDLEKPYYSRRKPLRNQGWDNLIQKDIENYQLEEKKRKDEELRKKLELSRNLEEQIKEQKKRKQLEKIAEQEMSRAIIADSENYKKEEEDKIRKEKEENKKQYELKVRYFKIFF